MTPSFINWCRTDVAVPRSRSEPRCAYGRKPSALVTGCRVGPKESVVPPMCQQRLPADTPPRMTPFIHASCMAVSTPCTRQRASRFDDRSSAHPDEVTATEPFAGSGGWLGEQFEFGDVTARRVECFVARAYTGRGRRARCRRDRREGGLSWSWRVRRGSFPERSEAWTGPGTKPPEVARMRGVSHGYVSTCEVIVLTMSDSEIRGGPWSTNEADLDA